MATITQIVTDNETNVSNKTSASSISPGDVGNQLDALAQEFLYRGIKTVFDVDALKLEDPNDNSLVHLIGRGVYSYENGGGRQANDYDLIAAPGGGFWELKLPKRRKGSFPEPYTTLFDLGSDAYTGGDDAIAPAESITYHGEFATAAASLTRSGNYDTFEFAGGDLNSTATFNNYPSSNTNRRFRLKVRVVTIGTASSFVGFFLKNVGGANDAGTTSRGMYVDLNAGVIYRAVGASTLGSGTNADITTGGIGHVTWTGPGDAADGIAVDGDLLELVYENRGQEGTDILIVNNLTTGHSLIGYIQTMIFSQQNWNQFAHAATLPGIILAGATQAVYQPLQFSCESTIPTRPFLDIWGDSMASGYNVSGAASLYDKLSTALQYNVGMYAGPGLYVNSMAKCAREIALSRPKYVLMFSWLPLYFGDFQAADPDFATFYASWTKLMKTIVASGGRPILVSYPPWPAGGQSSTSQPNWAAFINDETTTYDALLLDLSGHTFNYNGGSGFHLGDADNLFVKSELLKLLESVQAFSDL